jgi:hypothetical protein
MQFDPHAAIVNRDTGQPLLDEAKPVTLGFAVVRALDARYRDDENAAPSALFERYRLASRIRKAAPDATLTLSIDEAKLIKDTVPKMFPPASSARSGTPSTPPLERAAGRVSALLVLRP